MTMADSVQPINDIQSDHDVFINLEAEVTKLVKTFWQKKQNELEKKYAAAAQSVAAAASSQTSSAPSANVPAASSIPANKSLPWFANGIRGFLRKMWHGDSTENPDWRTTHWKESAGSVGLSLLEYKQIKNDLCNVISENSPIDPEDESQFVIAIMGIIRKAIQAARNIDNASRTAVANGWPFKADDVPNQDKINMASSKRAKRVAAKMGGGRPASNVVPEDPKPIEDPKPVEDPKKDSVVKGKRQKNLRPLQDPLLPEPTDTPESDSGPSDLGVLSDHQALQSAMQISDAIDKMNKLPENKTTAQAAEYKKYDDQLKEALRNNQIKLTAAGKIVTGKRDAVTFKKLVQIMKKADGYNWKDVSDYFQFFPLQNGTEKKLKAAIDAEIGDVKEPEPAVTAAEHNIYNRTNSIIENTKILKSLLKENNDLNRVLIKSRKLPIKDKIKYLKQSLRN